MKRLALTSFLVLTTLFGAKMAFAGAPNVADRFYATGISTIQATGTCPFSGYGQFGIEVLSVGSTTPFWAWNTNPNFNCTGWPCSINFGAYGYSPVIGDRFQLVGDNSLYSDYYFYNGTTTLTNTYSPTTYIILTTPLDTFNFTNNPVYYSGIMYNAQQYDKLEYYIFYNNYALLLDTASSTFILPNYISSWTHDINLPYIGSYTTKVRLVNSTTGSTTSWSNQKTFSLSSTTVSINTNISTSTTNLSLQLQTCGAFDFACQLGNSILTFFNPSNDSIQQFADIKTRIENKPPFGYITIIISVLGGATTTGATAFDITIPSAIDTYILTPLKVGLAGLLWFVALVWLYNRLKHIQL